MTATTIRQDENLPEAYPDAPDTLTAAAAALDADGRNELGFILGRGIQAPVFVINDIKRCVDLRLVGNRR